MVQQITAGIGSYRSIGQFLAQTNARRILIVCGSSYDALPVKDVLASTGLQYVRFSSFGPNPTYESVCSAVELFKSESCDTILAVGGGSAIDVAKCVKLFCHMTDGKKYLDQEFFDSGVPLVAVPTTAGTGSESTRYAVIYHNGEKQSVTHESILPNFAILDSVLLRTLPLYQKKCAMLDALCQGIESWWSVKSTEESKDYSRKAVEKIIVHLEGYINQDSEEAAEQMLLASNYAGKAINITQTTAPHAMSYKLTSLYSLPHGHAAAICLSEVWRYMAANSDHCTDPRGEEYVTNTFNDIAGALDCSNVMSAVKAYEEMLIRLGIGHPASYNREEELQKLTESVNPVRLANNPVLIDKLEIRKIYERIVKNEA